MIPLGGVSIRDRYSYNLPIAPGSELIMWVLRLPLSQQPPQVDALSI